MADAGPLEYARRWWLRAWLLAVFLFLYAPIVILVVFSFNDSRRNIVWRGFTTEYYANSGSFDFKTRIGSFKQPGCI